MIILVAAKSIEDERRVFLSTDESISSCIWEIPKSVADCSAFAHTVVSAVRASGTTDRRSAPAWSLMMNPQPPFRVSCMNAPSQLIFRVLGGGTHHL
jgi:hypothetical protein